MNAPTRHRAAALILCLATLGAAAAAPVPDVSTLLKAADRTRMGADNLQVETQVTITHADGTPDKERRYRVFAQAEHRSLVLMQSPAEQGQKVLMLGDDFWLLLPGSQRPVRITPSQKLLGDASTGDIATMNWADDYTGTVAAPAPCPAPDDSRSCRQLSLQATRKGVSYARLELWVGQPRGEPVAAALYLQSDKLAKHARFVLDKAGTQVDEMLLHDALGGQRQTRVRYLSRTPRAVPEAWLNPMFLARNPALE